MPDPNANANMARVSLTLDAAQRFPDIGTRRGTLLRQSGAWAIVQWDATNGETWLPADALEPDDP